MLSLHINGRACCCVQPVPEFVTKIIQIYDCKVARHGNMIVGKTGSGKSVAWKCLQRALGKLKAAHPEVDSFQRVHVYTINPLALSNDELYGSFEEVGGCVPGDRHLWGHCDAQSVVLAPFTLHAAYLQNVMLLAGNC